MFRFAMFALAGIMFALVGCQSGEAAKLGVKNAQEKTAEAVASAAEYAKQEKDEYVGTVQQEIDELKVEIEQMRSKTKRATQTAKTKLEEQVKELDRKWTVAERKLEEMKSASADMWKNFKTGVDKAMEDLRQTFAKSRKESG